VSGFFNGLLGAVGIYYFESDAQPEQFGSVFHGLWWAVATLTTVGYGDVYPVTVGGRIFTFFILLIGLGVISVPAGLVASALAKAREMEDDAR
jgi:voltage-gated potassium channel